VQDNTNKFSGEGGLRSAAFRPVFFLWGRNTQTGDLQGFRARNIFTYLASQQGRPQTLPKGKTGVLHLSLVSCSYQLFYAEVGGRSSMTTQIPLLFVEVMQSRTAAAAFAG